MRAKTLISKSNPASQVTRKVEAGSFTRAAESLGISRTMVTQLIEQLESHLRSKLLNRTTRRVNATTDDAAYYIRVVRLLAELEDFESLLREASVAPRELLRIDVPSPILNIVHVPALPAFLAGYPDIQFDLGVRDRKVTSLAIVSIASFRGEITDERCSRTAFVSCS